MEKIVDTLSITGNLAKATPRRLEIPIRPGVLKAGGNEVTITVLEGSWILFDRVSLEGPAGTNVEQPQQLFIRNIEAAPMNWPTANDASSPCWSISNGSKAHPRSASNSTAKRY